MTAKITDKTISTFMVLLVMFFTLAYPTSTALRAPVYILAFVWSILRMVLNGHGKYRIAAPLHLIWIVGFFILVMLSKYWHLYPQGLRDIQLNVLLSMMVSFIIVNYIVTYRVTVAEIAKLLVPIAVFFIFNVLFNSTRDADNRLSIGINENSFGKIGIGMAWIFLFQCVKTKWKSPIWIILMVVSSLMAFLSGSRRVVITLVICFIGYLMFCTPNKNVLKLFEKVIGAFALALILYIVVLNVDVLYNTIGIRIESLVNYIFAGDEADGSTFSRLNMQVLALDLFKEHPILGAGINAFKYHTYYGTYSHSNYTEILSGLGIVGFAVYYAPLIAFLVMAVKNWKKKTQAAIVPLCYLIAFAINEYGGVSYFSYIEHLYLGIAIGLIYVMHNEYSAGFGNSEFPNYEKIA